MAIRMTPFGPVNDDANSQPLGLSQIMRLGPLDWQGTPTYQQTNAATWSPTAQTPFDPVILQNLRNAMSDSPTNFASLYNTHVLTGNASPEQNALMQQRLAGSGGQDVADYYNNQVLPNQLQTWQQMLAEGPEGMTTENYALRQQQAKQAVALLSGQAGRGSAPASSTTAPRLTQIVGAKRPY